MVGDLIVTMTDKIPLPVLSFHCSAFRDVGIASGVACARLRLRRVLISVLNYMCEQVSFVILVLTHGIQLTTQDIVVLSVGIPFSLLWMIAGRTVVSGKCCVHSFLYSTCLKLQLLVRMQTHTVLPGKNRVIYDVGSTFVCVLFNMSRTLRESTVVVRMCTI